MKTLTREQVLEKMLDNVKKGDAICSGIESNHRGKWASVPYTLSIGAIKNSNIEFRLAPRTHTINGYEVPAPETEAPEVGTVYYGLHVLGDDGVEDYEWEGDKHDKNALRNGIWLSKEDAIANAKALRGENPYE